MKPFMLSLENVPSKKKGSPGDNSPGEYKIMYTFEPRYQLVPVYDDNGVVIDCNTAIPDYVPEEPYKSVYVSENGDFHALVCQKNIIWVSHSKDNPTYLTSPCLSLCLTMISQYDIEVSKSFLDITDDPRKELYYEEGLVFIQYPICKSSLKELWFERSTT